MSEPRLLTRALLFLMLAHFMQGLGYASNLLLPLYLDHLGANRATIGAVTSTAAVAGLLARPAIAWALDVWGRRPTILVGSVLVTSGMGLVFFVEDLGALLYITRILFGMGVGALFSAYFTFAADLIPISRRTEGIALFGVSGLVPLAVNPFADKLGVEAADVRWFIPLISIAVIASVLFILPLRETAGDASAAAPHERQPFRIRTVVAALGQRPLWSVWLATCAFSGLVALFFAFGTVTAERRGLADPASLWLTYAIGAIGVRLLGARMLDRIGPANLVAPSLALYLVGTLLLAGGFTESEFLWAGLLAGLGHGTCFPVLSAQVVNRMPDTLRGSGMTAFTALWSVSQLALPPIFGAIADLYDDATMFSLAALVVIVVMTGWAVLEHRHGAPRVTADLNQID